MSIYTGHARVNARNNRAFATCDRCNFLYNHDELQWQTEWAGPTVVNKRILVCRTCLDSPSNAFRTIVIPPDPIPIRDPRPEHYEAYETDFRVTNDGRNRATISGNSRIVIQESEPLLFVPGTPIPEKATWYDISGVIAGGYSYVISAATDFRAGMLIQNLSTSNFWINATHDASPSSGSIKLLPSSYYEFPSWGVPKGAISIYGEDTIQEFTAKEWVNPP